MTGSDWRPAFPLTALPVGRSRVFRANRHQIALFRPSADEVYAVDNRCPHEGYPLAQGRVHGRALVCAWHNFTFDLASGRCLAGDEAVRAWPVRVVDGQIEVDVAEQPRTAALPALFASLDEALVEGRMGQAARAVVRLVAAGVPAPDLALAAARFDSDRAEYGSTHALPVAADVLAILPRYPGPRAVIPLLPLMHLASEESERRPPRPTAEPIDPGPDLAAAGERLRKAVEGMRFGEAEGVLRGALARRVPLDVIEAWLWAPLADHFLGFGHPVIYQAKAFELLEQVGAEHAAEILPGHLVGIAGSTREDTIPTRVRFAKRLDAVEGRLAPWLATSAQGGFAPGARDTFVAAVLDGDENAAFDAVAGALDAGVAPDAIGSALALAAAERLLRFDPAVEHDESVQEHWLDVTHTLTFASAARVAQRRWRDPRALRLLFHAAEFVQRMAPLDLPPERRAALAAPRTPTLDHVVAAVAARRPDDAAALASGWLATAARPEDLRERLDDLTLGEHGTRPIIVAHYVKMVAAAFLERAALGPDPARDLPVLAAVRFMAAPLAERRLRGLAEQALSFVAEGRTPGRRTR
jgi:nitrite reductase/ring-hydroxylating ferredoxin subunit